MQPSSPSSRGGSRVGSVKYAHSPYVYRTTVEEVPVSPMSDHGRQDSTGAPQYYSPRSLSQSTGNGESSGMLNGAGSQADFMSQPSSPLRRSSTAAQEYSQPIQVGSSPNVHPRYRRGMQSPMTRLGTDSGSRGGFPSSPAGSLPPRSPFMARDDGTSGSAFAGGESAPVRGSNNPYRMNSGTGLSAPQYAMPLSGSYRGGTNSGSQSPSPHLSHQHNYHNASSGNINASSGGAVAPPYLPPPTSPPSIAGAAPAYSSSNTVTNATTSNANNNMSTNSNTYAPTGFSMPPTMTSANPGSYHGSPSGRGNSQSGSYVDPRSSHPSSPLLSGNSRPAMSSGSHPREPISPNHPYHSSGSYNTNMNPDSLAYSPNSNSAKNNNAAPPPTFSAAVSQQQQQGSGGFGVGSFAGRRAPGPSGTHLSSPFASHMNMNVNGTDPSMMSESYGTNTKTLSTLADDTVSSSGKSGSSASSIRDDLPLCPNDDACTMINDRKHQKKYAHTCRLFPCYHGHVIRHAKLFRHAPGQISLPEGLSANAKVSSHALASVNFSTISPEAPNAYRIYVSHGDKSYEIFGDWASVKVHTFKRYLHQVYHIPPGSQVLSVLKTGKVMDDDINSVKCYGIEEDSVIELRSDVEDGPASGKLRIPLDDL